MTTGGVLPLHTKWSPGGGVEGPEPEGGSPPRIDSAGEWALRF